MLTRQYFEMSLASNCAELVQSLLNSALIGSSNWGKLAAIDRHEVELPFVSNSANLQISNSS